MDGHLSKDLPHLVFFISYHFCLGPASHLNSLKIEGARGVSPILEKKMNVKIKDSRGGLEGVGLCLVY